RGAAARSRRRGATRAGRGGGPGGGGRRAGRRAGGRHPRPADVPGAGRAGAGGRLWRERLQDPAHGDAAVSSRRQLRSDIAYSTADRIVVRGHDLATLIGTVSL